MTRASIVIPSWNGREYLAQCLDSLAAQLGPDDEIIVVDNASTDGSPDLIRDRFAQVRLFVNERNLGFAGGINMGLRAASGGYLFLLNQDIRVQPGWLQAMLSTLARPEVGIAGCKLLYPDGLVQHAGGMISWPRASPGYHAYRLPDGGEADIAREPDYVCGAACGFRREIMQAIGLLDEGFWPGYFEDVDYCFRVRQAGWRVVYIPQAVAIHYESTSLKQGSPAYLEAFHRARLRLVFKWLDPQARRSQFLPAELEFLSTCGSIERVALRQVYRSMLRQTSDLMSDPQDVALANTILQDLYLHALETEFQNWAALGAIPAPPPLPAEDLESRRVLREHVFQSDLPVVGRLISWFRSAWNGISTRWYVRPLMQQQSEFNSLVVAALLQQQEQMRELVQLLIEWQSALSSLGRQWSRSERDALEMSERLILEDLDLSAATHDLAELTVKTAQLERRIETLSSRLRTQTLPAHEDKGG